MSVDSMRFNANSNNHPAHRTSKDRVWRQAVEVAQVVCFKVAVAVVAVVEAVVAVVAAAAVAEVETAEAVVDSATAVAVVEVVVAKVEHLPEHTRSPFPEVAAKAEYQLEHSNPNRPRRLCSTVRSVSSSLQDSESERMSVAKKLK